MIPSISYFLILFEEESRRERRAIMRQALESRLKIIGYVPILWEKNFCIADYRQNCKKKVFYSNTYRDQYGFCVYSVTNPVGIDLESKVRIEKYIDVLPYNSTRKLIELSGIPEVETVYWALQEAIGKTEGTGLNVFYEFIRMTNTKILYRSQSVEKFVHYRIYSMDSYQLVIVYREAVQNDI